MPYRLLLMVPMLLFYACAALENKVYTFVPEPPATTSETLVEAEKLAAAGRWSKAITLLDVAAKEHPEDAALAARRESMQGRWERRERELEDQILIGDAENQESKLAVLEELSLAAPGDLIVVSRRIYWKELLDSQGERLVACGEFHVRTNTVLARRCFQLASRLPVSAQLEPRLAAIGEQLRLSEALAAERRQAGLARQRQHRAKQLMREARESIEARDYRRALDILATVDELQPNNAEVAGLQEIAWSMISPQVEALVKLGDHLYLDEQLEAAVTTWQAALSLKPDDEAILARVERAKTVLSRLDALRQQQESAPTKTGRSSAP